MQLQKRQMQLRMQQEQQLQMQLQKRQELELLLFCHSQPGQQQRLQRRERGIFSLSILEKKC